MLLRLDTVSSRIDSFQTGDVVYAHGYSVLALTNSQVFYSYKQRSNGVHHIVKATYVESNYSMVVNNHQTINGESYNDAGTSYGENNETIWHAFSVFDNVIYFKYNLTNNSLIGNKYISSTGRFYYGFIIQVGEGIV